MKYHHSPIYIYIYITTAITPNKYDHISVDFLVILQLDGAPSFYAYY